ncbi:lipase family protein [Streptomyces sp. NBC_00162]|nr:lipase family protein [Streptomyces sp. NBC_00162]
MEANLIQQLTLRGWAVVVTDYEGLGTPGVHTYTVGPSAGHAMLDAARAATRLPETGLSPTPRSASWVTPRAARPAAGWPSCRARTGCRSRARRRAASRPTC